MLYCLPDQVEREAVARDVARPQAWRRGRHQRRRDGDPARQPLGAVGGVAPLQPGQPARAPRARGIPGRADDLHECRALPGHARRARRAAAHGTGAGKRGRGRDHRAGRSRQRGARARCWPSRRVSCQAVPMPFGSSLLCLARKPA
ncbi:MAG: hypothetical protein MZU84_04530 [Sphingobacterium sp.]|nr:hypothetical protein [Sphingobacterium sp.]